MTGEYNYYYQEANKVGAKLEVNLDQVATDLKYPIAAPVEGLIQKFDTETTNPGEYPTYVHIGTPPVIGEDGVIYGVYESPDIASAPITPAKDKAEWTTEVAIPAEVKGL